MTKGIKEETKASGYMGNGEFGVNSGFPIRVGRRLGNCGSISKYKTPSLYLV